MAFKYPIAHLSILFFLISLISFTLASPLVPRDSSDNRCGPQFGGRSCLSVGTNYRCCSQYSYCGDTSGHCGAGCQSGYGNCGASQTPSNPTPTPTPQVIYRSKPGSVAYGASIYSCTVPGTIALTFDDGPYEYTDALLDKLDDWGIKATFFITGNNLEKGAIDAPGSIWPAIIRKAYYGGHQIASHTWDHLDLDSLSETDRRFQMTRNEQALLNILGFYPTYMRPPYIRCGSACLGTMNTLAYHTIIWDLDTDDYNNDSPGLIQNSKDRVSQAVDGTNPLYRSFMSIAHDNHYETVFSLVDYQIEVGLRNGYRHVRLGECLGDPQSNWYRT